MLKIEKERVHFNHYLSCGFAIGRIEDFSNICEDNQVNEKIREMCLSALENEKSILQRRLAETIDINKYKPEKLIDIVLQVFSANEEACALIIIGYSYWFIFSALLSMKELEKKDKYFVDIAYQNTLKRTTRQLQTISPAINDNNNIEEIIDIMLKSENYNEFVKSLYAYVAQDFNQLEYDTFISYRRETGQYLAIAVNDALKSLGFKPFLDIEDLRIGKFNDQLYDMIDKVPYFVIILTDNALDRCVYDDDWVRLEIERAIAKNKAIVPVIDKKFKMPDNLPDTLADLKYFQAVIPSEDMFTASMQKLANLLRLDRSNGHKKS